MLLCYLTYKRGGKVQEWKVEDRLFKRVKQQGGLAFKFISPGYAGVPDRIVIAPGGRIAFVELKTTGMKPRKLQVKRIDMLKKLGCQVYVVDSYESVEEMIKEVFKDEV